MPSKAFPLDLLHFDCCYIQLTRFDFESISSAGTGSMLIFWMSYFGLTEEILWYQHAFRGFLPISRGFLNFLQSGG